MTLSDTAAVWRSTFDGTVVLTVLIVQAVGEHLSSGGSIVAVVPVGSGAESGPEAAAKAALSTWTASQADHFGARHHHQHGGLRSARPTRLRRPGGEPPSAATEIARMTVFLATPTARHISDRPCIVGRGAAVTYS